MSRSAASSRSSRTSSALEPGDARCGTRTASSRRRAVPTGSCWWTPDGDRWLEDRTDRPDQLRLQGNVHREDGELEFQCRRDPSRLRTLPGREPRRMQSPAKLPLREDAFEVEAGATQRGVLGALNDV